MAERELTGSRIRRRRLDRAISQSELAAQVGISAPYLNLIEHNRRKIGGRLLNTIAKALAIEPALLSEGAGASAALALRRAAAAWPEAGAETSLAEDLIGRFGGWARLIAAQARRIETLQDQFTALTDRLSHDPALASSLHEVISAVTSIRSSASILVSSEGLDRDWQARFHQNIHQDAQRLAQESRALAAYLEGPTEQSARSPQEEMEAALERHDQHLPALEGAAPERTPEDLARGLPNLSNAAVALMQAWARRYRQDAQALPLERFSPLALEMAHDPGALAAATGRPMGQVLRRLACLPPSAGHPAFGLAIADAAGALIRLRPLPGFSLPRLGACPLWPLFAAFGQPGRPLVQRVAMPGGRGGRFVVHAVAEPLAPAGFDTPARLEAVMLLRPAASAGEPAPVPVGTACRICPRSGCPARRETSILPS